MCYNRSNKTNHHVTMVTRPCDHDTSEGGALTTY